MSLHVVKVPDVGEGVVEVELVEWMVASGDTVVEDQPLAIVMTDKANVEIPSPVAGTVSRLGGRVGQTLAVGAELVAIDTQARATDGTRLDQAGHPASHGAGRPPPQSAGGPSDASPVESLARRPLASPSVRRHARELGVALHEVSGSGPGGRVRHEDVVAHAAAALPVATVAPAPPGAPGTQASRPLDDDAVQLLPMIGLRRRIAEATQEAWRRIPHFGYVEEVDVTELLALREALNAKR